ncbi:hypothetical protein [Nocardia sp. NPDC004260]
MESLKELAAMDPERLAEVSPALRAALERYRTHRHVMAFQSMIPSTLSPSVQLDQ